VVSVGESFVSCRQRMGGVGPAAEGGAEGGGGGVGGVWRRRWGGRRW